MSQHDKTSSKNLRSYLNSILLVPGIICLIIGIIDETKVGRVSLILGCLSLIGSYLSSYPLYQQLRKIQSKMGIELVVDYPGKVHELYSKASSSDVIYCCTSSWIVTEKLHRTLLEVKSMESYFVGPIVSDQQLYGALFRKWISDVRVAQSKTGFVILHRQESTTKFVLVGNSLVLSSANWQEESKEGFLYTEVSIAKTYREFFREIIIENTLQLEELVFNTFCSLVKKEGPLKLLVDKIAKNQKGSMFFSEAEIEETLTGIFRSLEDKGKVVLREDDKQTIIEVLVNDNHFAMNHIPSDRQKLPAVRVILNNKCNFDCFYCPDSNENYSGTPKTYLKPLDVKWIVETLIENHFTAFRLTGGEPTLLPRSYQSILSDLVRNNQDIEFKLATNGYDLNDVLDLYSDLSTNFTLKVSLDSIDFEKARKIANRKNINVNRVKESISEAVRRGISVGINSVITKSNADEIQDLIRFSLEEKVYLKLLDLDWYPDLKVKWKSCYQPMSPIYEVLGQNSTSKEISTHGGYGILMTVFELNEKTHVKIKDTKKGATYGRICKECKYYPCQEGAYQLSVTADLKLKVCRLRPDLGMPILQEVKNRDANSFLWKVCGVLKDFFFSAKRLDGDGIQRLCSNLDNYGCSDSQV